MAIAQRLRAGKRSVGIALALILVISLIIATWLANPFKSHAQGLIAGTPASATVDVTNTLSRLSPFAVGTNAAAWDSNITDTNLPGLLRTAGIKLIRYPGGSTADNYHWMTNLPDDPNAGGTTPTANFDAYMSMVRATGAQAMITVNYGSGTPQEAAGWVQYANTGHPGYTGPIPTYAGASSTGHDYFIRYWEVGNELYGNGTYGANWERDTHTNPDGSRNIGPTTYANGVVAFSKAMKAVDPFIKLGVVLTAPSNWPDGQTSAASPQPWNDTVLPIACSSIDFVDVHWYPQGPTGESDAGLLAAPENGESTPVSFTQSIPSMVATLKSKIAADCGAHAKDVSIMITETNSVSYNPGKQTTSLVNALYLDDSYMTWLENGVANVDWWDIHNGFTGGNNTSASLYGNTDYGDYGILSRGGCAAGSTTDCEPAAETPFPAYYGLQMLSYLDQPFGAVVGTTSTNSLVSVHAVRQFDGRLVVMVINKDPSTTYAVTTALQGLRVHGFARLHEYGQGSTGVSSSGQFMNGSSFTISAAPYSVTTVELPED